MTGHAQPSQTMPAETPPKAKHRIGLEEVYRLGLGEVYDQPFANWQIRSLYSSKQAQGHEQAKQEPGTRALLKDTL